MDFIVFRVGVRFCPINWATIRFFYKVFECYHFHPLYTYLYVKKEGAKPPLFPSVNPIFLLDLHQVIDDNLTVVNVSVDFKTIVTERSSALSEWVCNHAVTSLKADLWLE